MKIFMRVVAHLLFISGLVVFLVLPVNKYSWMHEIDPSVSVSSLNDTSGNRVIFTFLLLIAVVSAQMAIVAKSTKRAEKLGSAILALFAVLVWFLKFGS